MTATVALCSPEVVGYGRHAAPPSAYGPAELARLIPVSHTGAAAHAESGDAPVVVLEPAAPTEAGGKAGIDTGARSPGEPSTRSTGFWARLRLLPAAA
ncbi:hypothetical protein [Blastococcus montanus]|uniref:hypothetical protein n=1 Tax=Blastococcus montanus TaxID=3144973 RepID=UPI00320A2E79